MLGIYGTTVRIARFDHSCAIVSQPFDIHKEPKTIQRFLWHFAHPRTKGAVVGCDPTVFPLSKEDVAWTEKPSSLLV